MPPKSKKKKQDDGSKKADMKKKKQLLEDRTFGLKNKSKSKKVQAFVHSTEKSIMHGGNQQARREADALKMKKAANKARKKAEEQERDALFGEALLAVTKKTSTKLKGENKAIGRDGGADEKKVSFTAAAAQLASPVCSSAPNPAALFGSCNHSHVPFSWYSPSLAPQ